MSEPETSAAEQGAPERFKPDHLLLQKWQLLASRGDLLPRCEEGSELVEDMRSIGNQIISDSLQVGLVSAVEHLLSLEPKVANLAQGIDQPLAPFQDFSTARAALLSAVKAVWCLAPEERDGADGRVQRMLSVESDDLRGIIGFYKREILHASSDEQEEFRAVIELYGSRRKDIKARMGGSWPKSPTTMIQEAAEYLDRHFWRAPTRAIIVGEWQLGSAVAHGHSWPTWNTRNVRDEVRRNQNQQVVSRTVRPTPKEFYRALAVATCMTEIGLSLWRHRATVQ